MSDETVLNIQGFYNNAETGLQKSEVLVINIDKTPVKIWFEIITDLSSRDVYMRIDDNNLEIDNILFSMSSHGQYIRAHVDNKLNLQELVNDFKLQITNIKIKYQSYKTYTINLKNDLKIRDQWYKFFKSNN